MFAKEYKKRRVVIKNLVKRTTYINSIHFKLISRKLTSFQKLQKVIYKKLILRRYNILSEKGFPMTIY